MQLKWYDSGDTEHLLHDTDGGAGLLGCQLTLIREQGIGMPTPKDVVTRGPYDQADTLKSIAWQARTIKLAFKLYSADGKSALDPARREFASWFNPGTDVDYAYGKLRYIAEDAVSREIEARFMGGLDFDTRVEDYHELNLELTLRADEPFWYDPTLTTEVLTLTSLDSVTMPFRFPFQFASIDESWSVYEMTNSGDILAFPTITILGPTSKVNIKNATTGEQLKVNYTISQGEQIIFDLTPGKKSVKSMGDKNLAPYLSDKSSLGTWHLAADPKAASGVNRILFSAKDTTSSTAFWFTWYNRYLTV